MKNPVAPCKECEKREVGCRNACKGWSEYEREKKAYMDAYHAYTKNNNDYESMVMRRARKRTRYK